MLPAEVQPRDRGSSGPPPPLPPSAGEPGPAAVRKVRPPMLRLRRAPAPGPGPGGAGGAAAAAAMGLLNFTQEPVPEAVSGDMHNLNQLSAQVGTGGRPGSRGGPGGGGGGSSGVAAAGRGEPPVGAPGPAGPAPGPGRGPPGPGARARSRPSRSRGQGSRPGLSPLPRGTAAFWCRGRVAELSLVFGRSRGRELPWGPAEHRFVSVGLRGVRVGIATPTPSGPAGRQHAACPPAGHRHGGTRLSGAGSAHG